MRYFVPTRVCRISSFLGYAYPYEYSQGPALPNLCSYLAAGSDYIEVDDPNFFWCTHHREFNDCVHSKLVSYDGTELDVPVHTADGYLCLSSFKLSGGFQGGYHDYGLEYPWGVGTVSRSFGGWTYTLGCGKANNSTKTDMLVSFSIDLLRADQSLPNYHRVARYGVRYTSTKTARLELLIKGEQVNYAYKVGYGLRCISTEWHNDPLGLDKSLLTSAIVAEYENLTFKYEAGSYRLKTIEVTERILDIAAKWVETVLWPEANRRKDELHNVFATITDTELIEIPKPRDNFLLHEDEIVADGIDPYLVTAGQDWSHYWWNVLIQQAYLDALNSVPRLNDNSISNILEIVGFIKALVIDHKVEIPKSLSDIWLSYRYQYTTGKLDAKEAIDFVHRHRSLGTLDKWVSCFGKSQTEYQGTVITCRCGLDIRPKHLATLKTIWRALYTYGLQPNFYVIWDMIPYSFIVDWLIPVGKIASILDAEKNFSEVNYEIRDVIFSFSYDRLYDGYFFHQYTRFLSPGVVTLNGFYFFEEDPVSTKVIGYRALDLLSLTLGRR